MKGATTRLAAGTADDPDDALDPVWRVLLALHARVKARHTVRLLWTKGHATAKDFRRGRTKLLSEPRQRPGGQAQPPA